jgi:hypothetical protein
MLCALHNVSGRGRTWRAFHSLDLSILSLSIGNGVAEFRDRSLEWLRLRGPKRSSLGRFRRHDDDFCSDVSNTDIDSMRVLDVLSWCLAWLDELLRETCRLCPAEYRSLALPEGQLDAAMPLFST